MSVICVGSHPSRWENICCLNSSKQCRLSFKDIDAVLFRCHQGSRGTFRSFQSESYAAVKGGGGLVDRGGGRRRVGSQGLMVEVKIRNQRMVLIMQKQQSSRIKQPIMPAGTRSHCDFPSVGDHGDVAPSTANRQT